MQPTRNLLLHTPLILALGWKFPGLGAVGCLVSVIVSVLLCALAFELGRHYQLNQEIRRREESRSCMHVVTPSDLF
ncbi:MAG: hypothetical protein AB8F95_07285 [Bacteroidia bacterium]